MKPGEARGMVRVTLGGEPCIDFVRVARDPWLRFRGLMSRPAVPETFGQGLFFPSCRSLHTLFMKFPLDIAFLDVEGRIEKLCLDVPPWKSVTGPRSAKHSLEVTAGALTGLQVGDLLSFEYVSPVEGG